MLCIYAAIGRAVYLQLRLIVFFGGRIVPIIVFFLANAIKLSTSVCFSCIFIVPRVIGIVEESMQYASGLLLECVNLILKP
jgi:hypothetical protein